MSIPIPEAPMGRGWADIHKVKGVFILIIFCEDSNVSCLPSGWLYPLGECNNQQVFKII